MLKILRNIPRNNIDIPPKEWYITIVCEAYGASNKETSRVIHSHLTAIGLVSVNTFHKH